MGAIRREIKGGDTAGHRAPADTPINGSWRIVVRNRRWCCR
jgi:hypothetical protein